MGLAARSDAPKGPPDGERAVYQIVLRPDKEPKEIDLYMPSSKEPFRGIYKLEGTTLTIVLPQEDQARPKQFDTTKDKMLTSYTLRKVAK